MSGRQGDKLLIEITDLWMLNFKRFFFRLFFSLSYIALSVEIITSGFFEQQYKWINCQEFDFSLIFVILYSLFPAKSWDGDAMLVLGICQCFINTIITKIMNQRESNSLKSIACNELFSLAYKVIKQFWCK